MRSLRLEIASPVQGRVGVIDELKGLAILLVILYHASGVLGVGGRLHGDAGVDIFVVLSGVGIALGRYPGAGAFLLRRFRRIYPAYWVVFGVFLLADWKLRGHAHTAFDVILHVLGIHTWFGDAHAFSVNDSFWFITLIVSLYAFYVPLRALAGRPDRLLLAGVILSLVPAEAYYHAGQGVDFSHLSLRIPGFFIGILAGRLLKEGRLDIPVSPSLACALVALFYIPLLLGFAYISVWVGCALIAGYAFFLRPLIGGPVRRLLAFLGALSLEIFLIHQPLIRDYNTYVLEHCFPGLLVTRWTLAAGIVAGLLATVGLSWLLHRGLRRIGASP